MEQLLSGSANLDEPLELLQLRERQRKENTGLARITKFVFPRLRKKGPRLHLANANVHPSTNDATFQRTPSSEHVRKFEGEFARALSGPNRVLSGRVPELEASDAVREDLPGLPLDLSCWHLDLVVNKLQGRNYIQQRLVITREVIAMGCMGTSKGNDCQQLKLSMKVCVCVCLCAQTFDEGMCVTVCDAVGWAGMWVGMAWVDNEAYKCAHVGGRACKQGRNVWQVRSLPQVPRCAEGQGEAGGCVEDRSDQQ